MVKTETKAQEKKSLRLELLTQLTTLATSALGLVAALAWNDTIQSFVKEFVEPRIPGSGLISKLIYALLVTILAVFITYQLSQVTARFRVEGK